MGTLFVTGVVFGILNPSAQWVVEEHRVSFLVAQRIMLAALMALIIVLVVVAPKGPRPPKIPAPTPTGRSPEDTVARPDDHEGTPPGN